MKDFYQISKERLEAYLNRLVEASEALEGIKPANEKDKEKIDEAWGYIIDVLNSLNGFKDYEDYEAGGELVQDLWLDHSRLDNDKFSKIEFPKGVKV